jgi:hypothetical protein
MHDNFSESRRRSVQSDRELLEAAARAAGFGEIWYLDGSDTPYVGPRFVLGQTIAYRTFQPLTDDADAFRLAVALRLGVDTEDAEIWVGSRSFGVTEPRGEDDCAATRRAIVRAAAEIGRAAMAKEQA